MSEYRNPKVTTPEDSASSIGKWIGIAVAVLVAILVLMWMFGAFDGGETVDPVATEPTSTQEPAATDTESTTTQEPSAPTSEPIEADEPSATTAPAPAPTTEPLPEPAD